MSSQIPQHRKRLSAPLPAVPDAGAAARKVLLPSEEECRALMALDFFLEHALVCQREIPRSCFELLCGVFLNLWDMSQCPSAFRSQRHLCLSMLCLAPRVWPEPLREHGQRLKLHSRPKLIKAQIALLHVGKWRDLTTDTYGLSFVSNAHMACTELPSEKAGLSSETRLCRFEQQRHSVGSAWTVQASLEQHHSWP